MSYDVVVIGAGPNGLAAAALLAKAGRKTLLLERRPIAGGLAAGETFHPGYSSRGFFPDVGLLPSVAQTLDLGRHGLVFSNGRPPVYVAHPGTPFWLDEEGKGPEGLPPEEAARYADFRAFLARLRPFLENLMEEEPPDLALEGGDIWKLLKTALSLRRLGEKDMLELLRVGPMSLADWLGEWFESDALKAALAAPALLGSFAGPRSAGGAALLLRREALRGRPVSGGGAALARALEAAARANGAEIKTSREARRVRIEWNRVRGVEAGGEFFEAPVVLSTCGVKRTFLELARPQAISPRLRKEAAVFRTRGVTAKIHLALNEPVLLPGSEKLLCALRAVEGLEALEKAFDAAKYRRFSERPYVELRFPSLLEPGLAPAGKQSAELLVQYAPADLDGGWTPQSEDALWEATHAVLRERLPHIDAHVLARDILSPRELESRYGLDGGHIHHGEHTLDQLYCLRPVPTCARYHTPVEGLYLGGSGSHPGGGNTCLPGILAAKAILRN